MAALVDTNILVYRHDARFPKKQRAAAQLLREGIARDDLRLPHQAIVEFVAATTRPIAGRRILELADALREAEELLSQFEVLYPNETSTAECTERFGSWIHSARESRQLRPVGACRFMPSGTWGWRLRRNT